MISQELAKLSWQALLNHLLAGSAEGVGIADRELVWGEISKRILRYARHYGRNIYGIDPDDIGQVLLLKLQSPGIVRRIQASKFPKGYIFVMLRNAFNDSLRHSAVEQRAFENIRQMGGVDTEIKEANRLREQLSNLERAMNSLKNTEKELLHLRFHEGLALSAIAGRLGISYSAAAVRLHRAQKKVKEILKKDDT